LVISTGAVLSKDIDEVVSRTKDAVDLVRLPAVDDRSLVGRRLRALTADVGRAETNLLLDGAHEPVRLAPSFALTADAPQIARLLDANRHARCLLVAGALPEAFARDLAHAAHRRRRQLVVVVTDSTKVFFAKRGVDWYRRHGVDVRALHPTALEALTVNPVAPRSHRFDSMHLQALIREAIVNVPVYDVIQTMTMAGHEPHPTRSA
jgi:hypothetical protein